jgi:ACS family hexuronate transporter-like MFS transporter
LSSSNNAPSGRQRWILLSVFLLSTSINYLDRQTLANVAPHIMREFALTTRDYGYIVAAFSIAYAAAAPFAGWTVDRLGLTRGISLAILIWSLAGIATGLGSGLASLMICRSILGVAEAGGIPATGKAIRTLLPPEERAFGTSLNQAALSLGLILAPPLSVWIAEHYGWRSSFIVTGALGLLWIPLWWKLSPRTLRKPEPDPERVPKLAVSGRLWAYAIASALSLTLQSFWTNFTLLYLTTERRLDAQAAAWLAIFPPIFATAGGFAGGWLAYRLIRDGEHSIPARIRICLIASIIGIATAAIPWLPNASLAVAGISLSLFAVSAFSVNMYAIPLDAFGAGHAAFAISILTFCYGVMQALISPLFGEVIDRFGYAPICAATSLSLLASWTILRTTERSR